MKQYKGYYIDNVIFHNEKEIDESIKQKAIEKYKLLTRMFCDKSDLETNDLMIKQAEFLVNQCNMTYDEVEELEIGEMIAYR